jgi:TfoX/Sxy family transcriptional regulator of competence genes
MAYDESLEQRIDGAIAQWNLAVQKKKMFGGIGYLVGGNMAFGIHGDELIVRADEARGGELLQQTGTRHFAMGERTGMKNWYLAAGEAIKDGTKLAGLLETGRAFAQSLPPKK